MKSVTASPVVSALMANSIDYAGLFPPAKLALPDVVRNYHHYLDSGHAWMLGRLVIPAGRLDELDERLQRDPPPRPWPVSGLLGPATGEAWDAVGGEWRHVQLAAVEVTWSGGEALHDFATGLPPGTRAYVEIDADGELLPRVSEIAAVGLAAKLRTGSVDPTQFPSSEQVGRFLQACAARGISCKATAGLHHACRGDYPTTYAADSPVARMHGFLNVMLAAATLFADPDQYEAAVDLLHQLDANDCRLDETGLRRSQRHWSTLELRRARQEFFHGFGSCSFDEPIEELQRVGWLPAN